MLYFAHAEQFAYGVAGPPAASHYPLPSNRWRAYLREAASQGARLAKPQGLMYPLPPPAGAKLP